MYPTLSPGMIGVQLPFEECVKLAAEAGFKGIAVDMGAATANPSGVRQLLEGNKLAPAAWGLPVDFRKDDQTFQAGLANLPEMAKVARQIGAVRCSTWILPFSDTLRAFFLGEITDHQRFEGQFDLFLGTTFSHVELKIDARSGNFVLETSGHREPPFLGGLFVQLQRFFRVNITDFC